MTKEEYNKIQKIYNGLKDEIQDNPNCALVANKKLTEIVRMLYNFLVESRGSTTVFL
jgi:hypothetical protein